MKYLGSESRTDGIWYTEIMKRIALPKKSFRTVASVLTNNDISLEQQVMCVKMLCVVKAPLCLAMPGN